MCKIFATVVVLHLAKTNAATNLEVEAEVWWKETFDEARQLSPPSREGAGLLDVHIPKAGGTSLFLLWEPLLRSRVLCGRNVYKNYDRVLSQITLDPECEELPTSLLSGHVSMNVSYAANVLSIPRVCTVMILREPLARMVSQANFDNVKLEDFDTVDYLPNGTAGKDGTPAYSWHHYGSNLVTAFINGVPDTGSYIDERTKPVPGTCGYDSEKAIESARYALRNVVTVFGITEFYVESIWLFGRTFDWPRDLIKRPMLSTDTRKFCDDAVDPDECGKWRFTQADLKKETREAIRREEKCDRAVYQSGLSIFKARLEMAPKEIAEDLQDFKLFMESQKQLARG